MKQKFVKLEISRLVVIIIAVVAIAFAAGFFVQSSYFQGMVGGGGVGAEKMMEQDKAHTQKQALQREVNQLKGILRNPNFEKLNLEKSVMQLEDYLLEAKVAPELTDRVVSELKAIPEQESTVETVKVLDEFAKSLSLTEKTIIDSVQKLDADLKAL